jgi:hypothetical protein
MNAKGELLRAELNRTCWHMEIALAISWVFAAFSYYKTGRTGTDWFTRSGSLMGLMGAIGTFRLTGLLQKQLGIGLKEGLGTAARGFELSLEPPEYYQMAIYFSYLTGIIGTLIWGYGDVISRWVSSLFTSFSGG